MHPEKVQLDQIKMAAYRPLFTLVALVSVFNRARPLLCNKM